jgi:hypothetical protein
MLKITKIVLILALVGSFTHAKNRTVLGKVFERVILHEVDRVLDGLDKQERSKIIDYYQNVDTERRKTMSSSDIRREKFMNKRVKAFSTNGITIIVKYPSSVKKGEPFIIEARMVNESYKARMGGLTLSFPQYISLDGTIIDQKFDSINAYSPPEKMYSSSLKRNVRIKYFVIEGWEHKWSKDTSRFIKIQMVAPKQTDKLLINVRGVLIVGSKKFQYEVVNPTNDKSLYIDQQGFYVEKISINLED